MTQKIRLRIIGRAADGLPSPEDGRYVISCDVDAYEGRGHLETTDDPTRALAFDNAADALRYWRRQSTVVPLRPDGKPNRPLTAYHIEMSWA